MLVPHFDDLRRALIEELAGQAGVGALWLVVALAAGIAVFFAWSVDPWPWSAPAVGVACVAVLAVRRRLDAWTIPVLALLAAAGGFTAAQVRTAVVAAPALDREIGPREIVGRVRDVAREPGRVRVILDGVRLGGEDTSQAKAVLRVRLSVPAKHGAPRVGDVMAVRAVLRPPERPVVPGSFEYQRFLYFEGIGALGYTVSPWTARDVSTQSSPVGAVRLGIENLRRDISDRILALLPGAAGAVAVAFVTGEQSLIPEAVQEDYRVSGLAHLLSISGLHMSLLAAAVFVLVRRSLALWPWLALRVDVKKLAAAAALAATSFYVLISGMSVPAVRAFIMVAVVIGAIFVDRRVISLRSVAMAALVLLLVYPEALVGASFEMSFMAVIALVALYEQVRLRPVWRGADGELTPVRALGVYIAALVITDLVAGSVTSIFAAYHFNRIPLYSLAANTLAAPITGLWIMPLGLAALALMPFGADAPFWQLMGQGIGAINAVAATVADWPGAQLHVPPASPWALIVAAAGLLVICLWQGRLRWLGLAAVFAGALQPWLAHPPDLIVDENGRLAGVMAADGIVLNPGRSDRFVRSVLTDRFGRSAEAWPAAGTENSVLGLACDGAGCVLKRGRMILTLAWSPAAVAEDCGPGRIIVAPRQFVDDCADSVVIDRGDLLRAGAHALWLRDGRLSLATVADVTGERAWSRTPARRAAAAPATTARTEDEDEDQ